VSVVANVAINIDAKNAAQVLEQIKGKVEQMNGTFKKVPEATKSIGDMQKAVAGLVAKFVSVAAVTATVKKGIDAAFDLGAAQQRIKNLTGSTEEYEVAVALANQAASDFGISQKRATEQFGEVIARVGGLGYGLKEVNEIYRGFDAIAVQSGATAEEAAGAFEQLVQALGRGKLQGEDFRSVAGRMPAVLDALAKSAGVSRGELQAMASQGEITSDIIFKALSEQAAGFDGLSKRLNEQQKTFNDLSTATEKLLTSIGKLFGPAVIAGAKALANAADEIGTFFNYLASVVFPESEKGVNNISGAAQELTNKTLTFGQAVKAVLQVATFVGTFVGLIKSVAIGIQLWTKATLILAGAKKTLGAAMAFVLALTVKGLVVVAAAAAASAAAANEIGKQIDAVSAGMDNFTAQQKAAEATSAGLVNNYSSMPEKIKDAKDEVTAFTGAAEESLSVVRQQVQALDAQVASLERGASVNAARYQAELAINNLKGQQLQREFELAKTAEARRNIAIRIFQQQTEAAAIEYRQALENIALEQRKVELQLEQARIKYNEIEAEGRLQILKASSVEEEQKKQRQLVEALQTQHKVIDATQEQIGAQEQIGEFQRIAAAAQLESKVLTAQTALESKLVSDQVGMSQEAAGRLSTGLKNSAMSSSDLSSSTDRVANNAQRSSFMFIQVAENASTAADQITRAAQAQERLNAAQASRGSSSGSSSPTSQMSAPRLQQIEAFAKGGLVTKPTVGLIGEGGEPEYVIPASKMGTAAMNYISGGRGAGIMEGGGGGMAAPNISIQTGPVTQIGGQNFVSTQDLGAAVQSGIEQTLALLRNDSSTRRSVGIG